ncbi:uncharacterized protein [Cicer arietinum]|uniref:uncharacterized protein n=1 Tax=Cicer arietinum TaxID=3827 RepID=UPI003CC62699
MVVTYKDWHEMLSFALSHFDTHFNWGNPFFLVCGMKVVLPIKVEIPSIRVLMEAKLEESEWAALCHGKLDQKRLERAYEKKIYPREFREGDLVLKTILPIQKDYRGKLTPNYEGPYVVKKAFLGGALILENMDGKYLVHPVNSNAV